MTVKLIRIGNSRGIRLPKAVIQQAGLGDEVNLRLEGQQIIIESARKKNPREGWEEQIIKALAEHGDDADDFREWDEVSNEFDEKEWTWPNKSPSGTRSTSHGSSRRSGPKCAKPARASSSRRTK